MSPSAHKSAPPSHPSDQPSRVRQVSRMLPVIKDSESIHSYLLNIVLQAILNARRQVEGVVANENGQGLLFQGKPEDGVQIPEARADEIIQKAQDAVQWRGVEIQRTRDAIRIVAKFEPVDPFEDIGYKR